MRDTARQLDRVLTLLRNKIRERGFTQLEVQEALGWGRSYISQLLTKQKSLRVEQVLLILNVISVSPADFYAELFGAEGAGSATGLAGPRSSPAGSGSTGIATRAGDATADASRARRGPAGEGHRNERGAE